MQLAICAAMEMILMSKISALKIAQPTKTIMATIIAYHRNKREFKCMLKLNPNKKKTYGKKNA